MQHPPLILNAFILSGRRKIRLLSVPSNAGRELKFIKAAGESDRVFRVGRGDCGQGTNMMIDRRGEQREGRRRKAFSARRIVAGALAIFVILQGISTIGSAVARLAHRGGEMSLVASLLGVTCTVNAPDPGHSPAREHGATQCCVFCGARDLTSAALPALAPQSESLTPASARAAIERLPGDTPVDPPIGWRSSWSSRAPPLFS